MDTLGFNIFPPPKDYHGSCRPVAAFTDENNQLLSSSYKVNHSSSTENNSPIEFTGGPSTESVDGSKEIDHSDAILKFISQMLMEEEDLENMPCMLQDCLALQATEKSLYDALRNDGYSQTLDSTTSRITGGDRFSGEYSVFSMSDKRDIGSKVKKHHSREGSELVEIDRSNKHFANCDFESEAIEMYDKVLLCGKDGDSCEKSRKSWREQIRGRPKGSKKNGICREVVDLTGLLIQCSQAVANHDFRTANDYLIRIRQHSSPHGDSTERLAHYFATALEARLAGTGTELYAAFSDRWISAADILKAYKTLITACPFRKISNMVANKTISKLVVEGVKSLHIIDFGILYGFQWPCFIRALSERPGEPLKLRITGIDFPQPGFRPADRVAETGRRLAKYCTRFGVPFEYNPIAQKWETIKIEDFKIKEDELLIVNSLHRLQNVPDETVMTRSPRDIVLRLIRKTNPDMFIFGVINGNYNIPYFVTRFREALFQYSSLFDMFDATMDREDENRLLLEEQLYGKEALNIIACEGTERVEKPETYKQWQVRNRRAGFQQLPLDKEIVDCVKNKVKMEYHRDFSVDEDGKWMLQGWKGRVIQGISYWQPANKSSSKSQVP